MCGTIKYEKTSAKIGSIITPYECQWLGHIREESGLPKLPYKQIIMKIDKYTEKDVEFKVPTGKGIAAYVINAPAFPNKKGIFIITRPASKEELKRCKHPRHPKLVDL